MGSRYRYALPEYTDGTEYGSDLGPDTLVCSSLLSPSRCPERIKQKRLRLAVHCLGSAPTGLTSGVGWERSEISLVGLDGAIYGEEE